MADGRGWGCNVEGRGRLWLVHVDGMPILDVGGGHGQLTLPLVQDGFDVTVFASDDSCRERLDRIVGDQNYRLITGDLLNLPVATGSFDVVLGFDPDLVTATTALHAVY